MSPATIIVLAVVALLFGLAIWSMVKKSKSGGCASCGDCTGCSGACGEAEPKAHK
ncbi:MAG: FeoB-associated Cys-rich membrane protein [Oscillospiraceae bacterium]